MMKQFTARLHVLLASAAPVGLVIRRGPSKRVATLLWNRKTDQFQLGQWLKGRIYERRSDLSPDGEFFLYFAMNGKWHNEVRGSWTAISHAPYLKAVALFPKGDCWHGGGLWTDTRKYWLNAGHGHSTLRDPVSLERDLKNSPSKNYGGECPGVYFPRLLRDGWNLKEMVKVGKWHDQTIFEKPCSQGWILRKIAHGQVGPPQGKGCYWDEHELAHPAANLTLAFPQWEWAEWDRQRLVWAMEGQLRTGRLTSQGVMEERLLQDFNEMKFEPIQAPY